MATSRLRRPSLECHRAPVTDKGTWLTAKMAGEAEVQSYSYSFEKFSSSTNQEHARDYIQVKTSVAGASPCARHRQRNMADGQSQRSYTLPCWTAGDTLVQTASTYMAASPQSHAP